MAFIDQNKITVTVWYLADQKINIVLIALFQQSHGKNSGIEVIDFVITLPHIHQRSGTDDQGAGMGSALEVFDNRRADIALTQSDHVRHEAAAVIFYDLHRLTHRHLLEVGQPGGDFIIPEELRPFGLLQPILDQRKNGLHVDVIGTNRGYRPGLLELLHQVIFKVLGLAPQLVKPAAEFGMVIVALNHHIKLGVMGHAG